MSEGTKKVVVRLGQKVIDLIQTECEKRPIGRDGRSYTLSAFIRSAVCEKLKHLARGRKYTRKLAKEAANERTETIEDVFEEVIDTAGPVEDVFDPA